MNRVEICGGIASGKTTLARLLGNNIGRAVFEDFNSNPFWHKFYSNPEIFELETEITFFLQHAAAFKENNKGVNFFDYSLFQDFAYAKVNMSPNKLNLFKMVYDFMMEELGKTKYLIYLRTSPSEEKNRIVRRGRDVEQSISISYLEEIDCKLSEVVREEAIGCYILEIDSEKYDFSTDNYAKKIIIDKVATFLGR